MTEKKRLAEYLAVAEALKPQGISGEVKCRPLTDDDSRFLDLKEVYIRQNGAYIGRRFAASRVHDGFLYARLEGVTSRDDAEALRGELLYVKRADAVRLDENSWFIVDLIGCEIRSQTGEHIGTLRDVLQTGANDVWSIKEGAREWLMPVLKSAIISADVENGLITVDENALLEVDGGAY